jgi:glycosyltransferase involved in cell wall biosynthesis
MATRVLYVITKANWGGAQRYVYDLACAAQAEGYTVAVAYGEPGELATRLQAAHIPTFPIASLGRDIHAANDIRTFFSLLAILHEVKPDVIHLNSSKISGIGALAARLSHIPIILFTAHAWAFNEERPRYQKVIISFLAWLTVVLSTRTIVVSEAMRQQIIHGPFIRKKIVVISNGTRSYPLLQKAAAREALLALHPALAVSDREQDIWIGTVAELHPVKGLLYAIDAVRALRITHPTIRYLILGEGQQRKTLEKHIKENGLEQTVFLLGQVHEAPLYGGAYDIFLLPSLSESFGIAILEAGLAALPVVATRVGGIPDILTDTKTGLLVPSKNAPAIATTIDSLLANGVLRHNLGTALKDRVEKEFSIDRVARETFVHYH